MHNPKPIEDYQPTPSGLPPSPPPGMALTPIGPTVYVLEVPTFLNREQLIAIKEEFEPKLKAELPGAVLFVLQPGSRLSRLGDKAAEDGTLSLARRTIKRGDRHYMGLLAVFIIYIVTDVWSLL